VAARAEVPTRALQGALLASGMLIGVLAGIDPRLALIAALGIAFVGITLVSLPAGLCLFAVLSFIDTVIPYEASGGLSFPKLMGLLLVLSWVARLATSPQERANVFDFSGFTWVVIAFIAWVAFSITWAEHSSGVVETIQRAVPNALLFPIVFTAIRTRRQLMWLLGCFVIGAVISAAYGIAVPTDPHATERLSGAAGNANEVASALVAATALAGALAASLRDQPALRLIAAIGVPLCAYSLVLTVSRGGLVAFGASLLAAIALGGRWRGRVIVITAIAVIGCVTYFAFFAPEAARNRVTTVEGGTGRTDVWTVGWRMVEHDPWRGVGAGNFATSSVHYLLQPGSIKRDDFIVDTPKVAHNMYLEVLAEIGILGLVLFLSILGFSLSCVVRAARGFKLSGDRQLEILSRAVFVALVGILASDFFGSREFDKQLWLLLSLGPALLHMAQMQVGQRRLA
jgi:O-antigen ligase